MRYLDLTLPTPEENLALDEALLDEAEAADQPLETLRVWEPQQIAVVVGRSSQISAEVNAEFCRRAGVAVLRRSSGGAAVVTGPGCLMYALVLSYEVRPELRPVDRAHRFVLGKIAAALEPLAPGAQCRGISDLAIGDRKFSGNSMRCKRRHLIYHGTLLYGFPLDLVSRCLATPPRQPDYRRGRAHELFVMNLSLDAATLRRVLAAAWGADERWDRWPAERTTRLVGEKYGRPEWNGHGRG